MPFPDLQLVSDILKAPGETLPNVAEATGTPDAGNNTFLLPFVDAGVDPGLIDPSRLSVIAVGNADEMDCAWSKFADNLGVDLQEIELE